MNNVLIADDSAFMRMSLKTILEKSGFNVVCEAKNGREAIKFYNEFQPDIVTMDITMPEMTGIEALKVIKTFDPNAKVVMITSLGQESYIKDAIFHGAKSFIIKPFIEDIIVSTLKNLLVYNDFCY